MAGRMTRQVCKRWFGTFGLLFGLFMAVPLPLDFLELFFSFFSFLELFFFELLSFFCNAPTFTPTTTTTAQPTPNRPRTFI